MKYGYNIPGDLGLLVEICLLIPISNVSHLFSFFLIYGQRLTNVARTQTHATSQLLLA